MLLINTKKHIKNWWKSIDKSIFLASIVLVGIGITLILSISVVTIKKNHLAATEIIVKQLTYYFLGITCMVFLSCCSIKNIKKIVIVGVVLSFLLAVIVLFKGIQVKGAKRWIYIFKISIQPSEFLKIFLLPTVAMFLQMHKDTNEKKFILTPIVLLIISITLIAAQPDIGSCILLSLSISFIYFLHGISMYIITFLLVISSSVLSFAYFMLSHVKLRVNNFLQNNLNYQVEKALMCFKKGKLLGQGPGEGKIKTFLPDSHTDFIFSVAAEEMGILLCCTIVFMFIFITIKSFTHYKNHKDRFSIYSIAAIPFCISTQALMNICVNTNLMPTKGITLPLISYGGSSILSSCIGIGILLALSKKSNYGKSYQITQINILDSKY